MEPDHNHETLLRVLQAIDLRAVTQVAEAKRRGLGRMAEEVALRDAATAKLALRSLTVSYDSAIPADPTTAQRPEHVNKLLRIRGHLAHLDAPLHVEIPRSEGTLTDYLGATPDEAERPVVTSQLSRAVITGDTGSSLETQPFLDRQLVTRFQDLGDRYANWEFLAFLTLGTEEKSTATGGSATLRAYHLFLLDARPLITAIQMVGPTPGEIDQGLRLYGAEPNVINLMAEKIAKYLEIHHLDQLPTLREAIRFQILAAATEGARAHTLVIGPPGVGKSLIHKVAKLIQPVFRFALPSKVTDAGLIGTGYSNATQRHPGLIPQCHTGAFSVEDFHAANKSKNQRMCATFSHVMAEGVVSDASAAMVEYVSQVSIVIDANRQSDVRRIASDKAGFDRVVDDIGIPMNILSRMTFIAESPRDTRTQLLVSLQNVMTARTTSEEDRRLLEEEIRLFKVYAALMRDRHANVHIPTDVRTKIQAYVIAACDAPESRFEQHGEFSDFATRLSMQVLMLVEAHARLHNREEATPADVDAVYPFLWRKMDWVKDAIFGGQIDPTIVTANTKARRLLIQVCLKGSGLAACTPKEIRRSFGLHSTSLAIIESDLRALIGEPDEHGTFHVVAVEHRHD